MAEAVKYKHIREQFSKLRVISIDTTCYRMIHKKYDPLDAKGSILYSGRYNNGEFFVLYLSESKELCKAEITRKTKVPTKLKYKIAEIKVRLNKVIDLTYINNLKKLNIKEDDLISDSWEITQYLASLAYEKGYEALIVPSATRRGENIVILLENRTEDSTIKKISERIV